MSVIDITALVVAVICIITAAAFSVIIWNYVRISSQCEELIRLINAQRKDMIEFMNKQRADFINDSITEEAE